MNPKESETQKQVMDYLRWKKIFCYKVNNWGFRKQDGGFIPQQQKGIPDIICHYKGQVIYLEIKSEKGKQSEHQLAFNEQCVRDGIQYFIVRNLDQLIKILDAV